MKSFIVAIPIFASAVLAQTGLMINTPPSYIQCQPAALTFSGGVAPYYLAVLPGGMSTAAALENLPTQTAAGSYAWTVNLAAGTNITIRITDSQGNINYNSARVIQAGTDSTCLSAAASSAATTGAVTTTATSAMAVVAATSTGSLVSSTLTSASPSATVTASSGAVPSTNMTAASSYNFTCSQGLLTYGITTVTLPGVSLRQAESYFSNWTSSAPGTLVSHNGTGVNATRSYTYGSNVTFSERLLLNMTNATALHQQWNFTTAAPIALTPSLTVFNAFDDLQVYTNASTNATSLQYFILACFNNQTTGLAALAQEIQSSVGAWAGNITASNATATARATRRSVKLF